jgi:rRNA maturation RNase YbeY
MIRFFTENISFNLTDKKEIKKWITDVVANENKKIGNINFIFCSNDYLLGINQQYLNHNYFTDVITFDYSDALKLSGDIFISVDCVRENSVKYRQLFEKELYRVMVHGVLHLCLYGDSTKSEIAVMRSKENYYLEKIVN